MDFGSFAMFLYEIITWRSQPGRASSLESCCSDGKSRWIRSPGTNIDPAIWVNDNDIEATTTRLDMFGNDG